MKKKITLIVSILLILALAVTFVGCNKDKTEDTPTTEASEKVSTTEPTTKFEAPEIKEDTTEETTEATTEETTKAPETTKKPTYSYSSGSSNSGSPSNSSSNSSSSSSNDTFADAKDNGDGTYSVTTKTGATLTIDTNASGGGHSAVGDVNPDGSVVGDRDGDGDYDADDSALVTDPALQLGRG